MQIKTLFLLFVLCFALIFFSGDVVEAQSKTIVVPDDYLSVFDAVGNASEGDTVFVKEGIYDGPINQTLVITKSISLIGESTNCTQLIIHPALVPYQVFTQTFMGYSEAITIKANDVTLTGFTIASDGGSISARGNSIKLVSNKLEMGISVFGNYTRIENNEIEGGISFKGFNQSITSNSINVQSVGILFMGSYNNISYNKLCGSGDGIFLDYYKPYLHYNGSFNVISYNEIACHGSYGIRIGRDEAKSNTVAKNFITGCGDGIRIEPASNTLVFSNVIVDNGYGINVVKGHNNTFFENIIEKNQAGVRLGYDQSDISREKSGPKAFDNIFFLNNFVNNTKQAIDWNWLGTNHWDNGNEGNYWSDYNGTDYNNDGIGDSPYFLCDAVSYYAPTTQSDDIYPLMEPVYVDTIPEFSSWAILSIILTGLLVVTVYRKKLKYQN